MLRSFCLWLRDVPVSHPENWTDEAIDRLVAVYEEDENKEIPWADFLTTARDLKRAGKNPTNREVFAEARRRRTKP